jgi:hypothetical protein
LKKRLCFDFLIGRHKEKCMTYDHFIKIVVYFTCTVLADTENGFYNPARN